MSKAQKKIQESPEFNHAIWFMCPKCKYSSCLVCDNCDQVDQFILRDDGCAMCYCENVFPEIQCAGCGVHIGGEFFSIDPERDKEVRLKRSDFGAGFGPGKTKFKWHWLGWTIFVFIILSGDLGRFPLGYTIKNVLLSSWLPATVTYFIKRAIFKYRANNLYKRK